MRDLVLSIDVGTQSTRALIFDARGELLHVARSVHEPAYVSAEYGWAERDPELYWRDVCKACTEVLGESGIDRSRIASIAMTFQRGTIVNLDANARPLRPAMLWVDARRATNPPKLPWYLWAVFNAVGVAPTVRRFQAETEVNWIAEHQPEIHAATAHQLLLSGYLTYQMTGLMRDSVAAIVAYLPFDYKRQQWGGAGDWKWKAIAARRSTLPELVVPGQQIGVVSAEASALTGIPEGVPVIAAGSDKACEVLGAGCVAPHQGCLGYGTTATLNVSSPRYVEPSPHVPPYPSARPGHYDVEYQLSRGMWLVTWFKEQFGHLESMIAKERGISTELALEEEASTAPPGCMGLTLQPYFTAGVYHPGPEAKGALIGFGPEHKRHHVYRALLEGLAYDMRRARSVMERRTGTPMTEMWICGGGSRSDLLMQINADVLGIATRRPACNEASGLGAAILAAVGAGIHPDIDTAVKAMTREGRRFEPNPDNTRLYSELFDRVYRPMYGRLRPLYKAIQRITGYPAAV